MGTPGGGWTPFREELSPSPVFPLPSDLSVSDTGIFPVFPQPPLKYKSSPQLYPWPYSKGSLGWHPVASTVTCRLGGLKEHTHILF